MQCGGQAAHEHLLWVPGVNGAKRQESGKGTAMKML